MNLTSPRSESEVEAYRRSLAGREVLVIGAARSGMACLRRLAEAGARLRLGDSKTRDELGPAGDEAEALGATVIERFERLEQAADADLVISSPGVPPEHPALVEARARGLESFGTMEFGYRLCPGPILAITGTNGKGTTCRFLAGMLERAGINCILAGNIGLPLADEVVRARADTAVVLEVSSFQLETIVQFRPRVATLLNVAPDHFDRHPTMGAYAAAKGRIFENQRPEDFAVINNDESHARQIAETSRATALRVSLLTNELEGLVAGGELRVRLWGEVERICPVSDIPLAGEHHLMNALIASVMARLAGAAPAAIGEGIRAYRPPRHHMEVAGEVGGVVFINDTKATNPASAVADMSALQQPFVAIVGGRDKGADFAELAALLRERPRAVILIGEAAERIAEAMGPGATPERAASLEEAVERAAALAEAGDAVIMAPACSSFDMFHDYEQRGDVFMASVRGLGG